MALDNVHDLLELKLQTMYSAESRILEMLEDTVSDAKDPKLRELLQQHRQDTEKQVERLEDVFQALGRKYRRVDASVVEGLVEERRRFLNEDPTPDILDVFHIGAAIKTEHIEIASYETLITLAEQMGAKDLTEPLRANLREEQAMLEKLMGLARDGKLPERQAQKEITAR